MFTVVFLVKKKKGQSFEDFTQYWIVDHTPLTAKTAGILDYRCYPFSGGPASPGAPMPYDGIGVINWESREAYDAALESPEFQAALADAVNFQTTEETLAFFAEEATII